jgi:hypothetical protein
MKIDVFLTKENPIMPRPKCEHYINWHIKEVGYEFNRKHTEWAEFGLYWKEQEYFNFHKSVRYVIN